MHPPTNPPPPINAALPNVIGNPNVNAQMQKIMEQKLQHQMGSNVPLMQNPNPVVATFASGGELASVGMGGMSTGPHVTARPTDSFVEWTGTLKWSGQGPTGMREMQCVVTIASAMAQEKA
jgi:hypothetical protein